jgi:hypothetical protein
MSRFASGSILGFLLGAFLVVVLASESQEGFSTTHFKLPLKFELEFGEATAIPAEAISAKPDDLQEPAAPAKVPAEFQSVVEQRQIIGSALAGTLLDVNCPDDAEAGFVAALKSVAAEAASAPAVETLPVAIAAAPPSPLEGTIAELYRQADECELSCDFERADRFRRLAREIRREIDTSEKDDGPKATTADTRATDDGYPLD